VARTLAPRLLVGHFNELDAPDDVSVDEQHGVAARLIGHVVTEDHAAAVAEHLGQRLDDFANVLISGQQLRLAAGIHRKEDRHWAR